MVLTSFISALIIAAAVANAAPAVPLHERANPCPYASGKTHTISFTDTASKDRHTITISYLGKGSFGCAYDVLSATGSNPLPLPAVAKTPRIDRDTEFEKNEIKALTAIKELHAYGTSDGKAEEWIVIKKHPGKHIFDTEAWKRRFPKNYNDKTSADAIADCRGFMRGVYHVIAQKYGWYATKYGYDQGDLNWNNYLFSDDLQTVNIIDWGMSYPMSNDPHAVEALEESYLEALEEYSALPLKDTTKRKKNVQGVCDSEMRKAGQAWFNPMANMADTDGNGPHKIVHF